MAAIPMPGGENVQAGLPRAPRVIQSKRYFIRQTVRGERRQATDRTACETKTILLPREPSQVAGHQIQFYLKQLFGIEDARIDGVVMQVVYRQGEATATQVSNYLAAAGAYAGEGWGETLQAAFRLGAGKPTTPRKDAG